MQLEMAQCELQVERSIKKGNKKIGMQKIKHQINDGNKIWDTIY